MMNGLESEKTHFKELLREKSIIMNRRISYSLALSYQYHLILSKIYKTYQITFNDFK